MPKIKDKLNESLEEARINPIIMAVNQANAGWLYMFSKWSWWLPEKIFGKDACTMARIKVNEKLNK